MTGVYPEGVEVERGALISPDAVFRYQLTRLWGGGNGFRLPFLMLNPSTADATDDDPTIRRCVGFARAFGFSGIAVWNLYAFRATAPSDLWTVDDPVGPTNDNHLRAMFQAASAYQVPVVAAWGNGARQHRVQQVINLPGARQVLHHLGTTKTGAPKHPLYIRAGTALTCWSTGAPWRGLPASAAKFTRGPSAAPAATETEGERTEDEDWPVFLDFLRADAGAHGGRVDPNRVRADLSAAISPPQRIGRLYRHAKEWTDEGRRRAVLDDPIETTSTDASSGNAGKPIKTYRFNDPTNDPALEATR